MTSRTTGTPGRVRRALAATLAAVVLAGLPAGVPAADPVPPQPGDSPPPESPDPPLDFSLLTHVAYFSVGADAKGNLRKRDADGSLTTGWAGWTSSQMTSDINAAHARG